MKRAALALLGASAVLARADVLIDDFNSTRTYGACCGEFGAYDSFLTNVTQNGSGSVVVAGTALNEGGFYHGSPASALWDLSSQTGLVVTVRAGVGNHTGHFWIFFQDTSTRRLAFYLPLNTTNFTTLTKSLAQPDFADSRS